MCLCAVLLLAGCSDEAKEEDLNISEITIYNIPATIPVAGSSIENELFKVYLMASNDTDAEKPPAAQGIIKVDSNMLQANGTYRVTIPLRKPIINLKPYPDGTKNPNNPDDHEYDPNLDANLDDGPWRGTAKFFSVIISPQDVRDGVNTIWVRGSTLPMNSARANVNWNTLVDFRNPPAFMADRVAGRAESLFDDVLVRDKELIVP